METTSKLTSTSLVTAFLGQTRPSVATFPLPKIFHGRKTNAATLLVTIAVKGDQIPGRREKGCIEQIYCS
jgi:hypothetical protein